MKWSQLEDKATKIADKLGKQLDKGIKEVVISLWSLGFPTLGSCEGHIDWGVKAPWVDIGEDLPEKELEKLKLDKPPHVSKIFEKFPNLKRLKERNLKRQRYLLELLTQYYKDHKVLEDERLILTMIGIYGFCRLTNQGAEIQEVNTKSNQKIKLKRYQQEILL